MALMGSCKRCGASLVIADIIQKDENGSVEYARYCNACWTEIKNSKCNIGFINNDMVTISIGNRKIEGLITDVKFSLDQDCPGITITSYLQLFENELGLMSRLIKEKVIDIDEGYDITVELRINDKIVKNIIYKKCTMYDNEVIANLEDRIIKEVCYFDAESLDVN